MTCPRCSKNEDTMARVHREIHEVFMKYDLSAFQIVAVLEIVKQFFFQNTWQVFDHYNKEFEKMKELENSNVYS